MKKFLMLCLSLVMAVSLVGCGKGNSDDKVITVLTSSGYEPYEVVDAEGNLSGFDIDVMEECAKILGYTVEWKDMDFDGIIDSVKNGQGDVAIAGISPSPERAEQVDFSNNYYATEDSQNYVLVRKDSGITTTADIKGKSAGVQKGTIQEGCAHEIEKEYELYVDARTYNADLLQELLNKRVDFMILEKAVAEDLAGKQADDLTCFRLEAGTDPSGNAMVFKKGSDLVAEFNDALKQLEDNGTLAKLVTKYFGE